MIKKLFLIFNTLLSALCLFAQQGDPVVFSINGNPVYKYEVEYARKKNESNLQNKEPISDFIQSYIEFRMNVEEAKSEQLDTTANYLRQLASYRKKMAEPYLQDTVSGKEYVKKIYDRLLENVEINHLLLPFDKDVVFPVDTVLIYKKALDARNEILKNGFSTDVLKMAEATPNRHQGIEGKNGYLGWIAPFMLSAQLENIVYTMGIGEISMPVRTLKGYHIVQVLSKRSAIGSAEIEQVMFRFNQIPATQYQIDSVRKVAQKEYNSLQSGTDFDFLCKAFSDAYKTGEKGCYFGMVGVESNLSPEFISAVFALEKTGDISKPVKTDYGFHIVRLLRKIPVPDFDILKNQIIEKLQSASRIHAYNKEKKQRLMQAMGVKLNEEVYAKLNEIAINVSPRDSSFLNYITNEEESLVDISGRRNVPVKEFGRYISYRQKSLLKDSDELEMMTVEDASPYSLSTDILKEYLDNFLAILAADYQDDILEEIYPDFNMLMSEFSGGLLSLELKNKYIWDRAKTDDTGLANYFSRNKSKYKLDQPRYKGVVIYAKNEKSLKEATALAKKAKTLDALIHQMRNTVNKDSVLVRIEPGLWIKGENKYVDHEIYGEKEPAPFDGFPFFQISGKFIKKPEEYKDVRAEVEFDYQNQLEKEWSTYLKNKYKVDINESVLNTIE